MLTYHRTSILTAQTQTVVNTINTVGVMGKGLASAYKSRYPAMFKTYKQLCKEGKIDIGRLWLWKGEDQWVLNFPTKKHWRNPSKLTYIEAGLKKFVEQYEARGIWEIAFPRLGCGNGGLDWDDVGPLMESYLKPLPIPVYVHDFEAEIGIPEHRERESRQDYWQTFDKFMGELQTMVKEHHRGFKTLRNKSVFGAEFDSEGNLVIDRPGRKSKISTEEMFEVWTLLLRGPLTRRKLSGAARNNDYQLLALLAMLPFVRPIEIAVVDDEDALIAVELIDQGFKVQELAVADNPRQSAFQWA
jgi:O-acetyl-ADP-ribose deacetylase (regulator of RNase III)